MKIKILKDFLHGRDKFVKDETRVTGDGCQLSNADAEYFCRAGWAEDLDGIVATGNPSPTDVVLQVENVTQSSGVDSIEIGGNI